MRAISVAGMVEDSPRFRRGDALQNATHGQRLGPQQTAVHEIPALRATNFLCHRLLEAGKARLAKADRDVVRRLGSPHTPGRSILTASLALLLDGGRRLLGVRLRRTGPRRNPPGGHLSRARNLTVL